MRSSSTPQASAADPRAPRSATEPSGGDRFLREDQLCGNLTTWAARNRIVNKAGHDEAEDPGDVGTAQSRDARTGVKAGREKRNLHEDTDQINHDPPHVPPAITPVRISERGYVVTRPRKA